MFKFKNKLLTWATPSSQPRITSWCPILNLNGFPRDLEESNTFPSASVPDRNQERRGEGRCGGGEGEAGKRSPQVADESHFSMWSSLLTVTETRALASVSITGPVSLP